MKILPIKILLVEDTPSDAKLIKLALTNSSAPSVTNWVQTLHEAKRLLKRSQFDIVLTDLSLPDSDGIETIKALRSANDQLPIIALTGHEGDIGLATIRAGANDFISKSNFDQHVVSRAIKYTIERFRMTLNLNEANRLLESKNERLAKMYKMSQQFVDNVSHEFRTPLTVIREFAAILRDGIDGPVTSQQERRLSKLINRTDDLARMVDDLLDTSRLESGLLKAYRTEHDLSVIVEQVARMLSPRAKTKEISIQVPEIPAETMVFCDEEKLRRTLINLLVNAIKFTPQKGSIEISAAMADNDRIKVTVSDSGPGIASAELKRIFERFEQVESHHRMASCRGFGLGLSIARDLASLNLGSLAVASVEGEGSQFSVSVPIARIDSVLRCYFDQRESEVSEHAEISAVEVSAKNFDTRDESDVLETIDDFLRMSVKAFDLTLQVEKGRWLIYSCNSEKCLPMFFDRLNQEWAKFKRNHFGAQLPDLKFENKITTCVLEGRQALMKFTRPTAGRSTASLTVPEAQNKRVLIVDDEIDVAGAIESRLTASGYQVSMAHDGVAGLQAVSEHQPHAVLLDIRMPKLDGLAVLNRLKDNPETAATPVIVLSASLHDKQVVLDSGASYFIQKPYESDSLLAALGASLQQQPLIN